MSMPLAAAGPLSMPPPRRDDGDIEASIDEVMLEAFPAVVHGEARKTRDRSAATETTTQTCCPVCLVNYGDGNMLWVLPDCSHLFHWECVDPWLRPHADAGRYGQAVVSSVQKHCRVHSGNKLLHVTDDSRQTNDAGCMDDSGGDDETPAAMPSPK
ncbi:hypothetical protein E2562_022297 [Oryza meyeriana var. granulata]|uniref:RING-type domain-containing protein n=1 Tax=Oryza meyeriana var. granulata TaxID=110450 RepID=A0A6G1D694_9ORYZ|nr:hypothetical protein E2562_022297 [Oryza meyeriana var. granulata]